MKVMNNVVEVNRHNIHSICAVRCVYDGILGVRVKNEL
jgi:hypothetical protein